MGHWEYSGDMGTARYSHTATLLADGRVLVSGGQDADGEFLRSCEIWDPRTGGWAGTGDLIRGGMSTGPSCCLMDASWSLAALTTLTSSSPSVSYGTRDR